MTDELTDHHPECEDVTGAYPGSCNCAAIKRREAMERVIHSSMPIDFERRYAMDNLIAQDADLIDVASKVTEADREVLIRISNSDDETASRIHRGLIYTWEVGEIARHRQYGYDQGYYDGCTRAALEARGLEIREKGQ